MFEVIEGRCGIKLRLTRGDSGVMTTIPYNDVDNDGEYNPEDENEEIILGENDYVLFTVASGSGRKYITKLLTKDDYNAFGVLQLKLSPADTKDMQPFTYYFSFQYMPDNGSDCFTYSQGEFELLESISTVDTLTEILTPKPPDTETEDGENSGDIPDGDAGNESEPSEDNTGDNPNNPEDNTNNGSDDPESGEENIGGETDGDNG